MWPTRVATSPRLGLDVVMAPDRAGSWEERHRRGEVPGRWPYGLHHLADGGATDHVDVRLRGVPRRGRVGRTFDALLPRHRGRIGLAWEENLAQRMVATRRYEQMHTGIIWATDRWSRAADLPPSLRQTLERMTSVWALSRPQVDALDGLLPSRVKREFVKFGIDSEFFALAPYPERPMVFSAGRDRHRDTGTLLEAFALVGSARPGVRLVLQSADDLTAPPGVEILPRVPHRHLRDIYAAASVVAVATSPNLHVSGMTVALEAQATGRPAVLSRTPGTEDYVDDGSTGALPPVGDAKAMAQSIIDLLDDPGTAAEAGRRGRSKVEAAHTDAHLSRQLRRLVDR